MLFFVYDQYGNSRGTIQAVDARDAINNSRNSLTNRFPMVESEFDRDRREQVRRNEIYSGSHNEYAY